MRILWLSHFLPYPPRGGAVQRSHHLLRHAARRHEVHLVALNQRALLPTAEALSGAVGALEQLCATVQVLPNRFDGRRLRWAAMVAATFWRTTSYDVNWLHHPALCPLLDGLAAADAFDLVHVDTLGLMPYATCVRGLPIVLNHHNVESHMMARRATAESRWLPRLYLRREAAKLRRDEQRWCRQAAVNVIVSSLDAERVAAITGGCETVVVENGVDVDYFRPSPSEASEPGHLVFVGTMDWYPNRDAVQWFLREVWPALRQRDPRRRLTVIGRDPPGDVRGVPGVSAPGLVEDIRPHVARAAVYVCPLRDGGGTRLKVLDALAMGKPLVGSGLAVEGLDLVDGQHYLRAETPGQYVRQIERLDADPGLRERLARDGRRLVERRYSWDALGPQLDEAYDAAVRVRGAAAHLHAPRWHQRA